MRKCNAIIRKNVRQLDRDIGNLKVLDQQTKKYDGSADESRKHDAYIVPAGRGGAQNETADPQTAAIKEKKDNDR